MDSYNMSQVSARESEQKKFMARVYGWMAFALALSFVSALAVAVIPALWPIIFNGITLIILCIVELGLVFFLTGKIRTMSVSTAKGAFVAYSIVNGLTLSSIFLVYKIDSIFAAFLASSLMFGAMSIYGAKTKRNLNSIGRYLTMAIIGIVMAVFLEMILSFFMNVTWLDMLIALVTVVVFTGLTAYDTQRMMKAGAYANGSDVVKKAALIGALELYLDFINIFLALLRLFGRRRN